MTSQRVVACMILVMSSEILSGQTGALTYHNDNQRTGVYPAETLLTSTTVNPSMFGKLFVIPVDGKVDAQPLYVPLLNIPGRGTYNVLFVATEHDSVYAFDADTGASLWGVSLLKPGETTSDDRGCSQVSPEIGITATPVIDPSGGPRGAIYVIAMSKLTDSSGSHYFQRFHALDLTTGGELFGGPVDIQATFPGTGDNSTNGTVVFDPKQYKERPGLLLLNGVVYTAWSSHCDIRPYTGWIIGYDKTTLRQVAVLNLAPNGSEASVWQSGAGIAADLSGNIFLLAANGTFDTTLNASGFPSKNDYGNGFLKISTSAGALTLVDYFATFDTVAQSNEDSDLGSGGALVLPDLHDSQGGIRHLAVGAGKDRNIYIVDRDNMGKFNPYNNGQIYQELAAPLTGPVFSMPAFLGSTLYYGGVGDSLKAFAFVNGFFVAAPQSESTNAFPYPGTTPSISANGAGNAIVWAAENGGTAVLHAYDATGLSHELYNSNQAANSRDHFGAGNKFITPLIANGKVYVGTTNGVGVFGLLNCHYSLSTTTISAQSSGASGTITVTAEPGCQWTSYNNSGFVTLGQPSSGTGSMSIPYAIGANAGPRRTAQLAIAGRTLVVIQAASGVRPGDLDGNGVPDTVLQFPDGSIGVWYLGGTGHQLSINSFAFLAGPSSGVKLADIADLNGDGIPDLILQFADGSMSVSYLGGPQRSSITGSSVISGPIQNWRPAGMADLNNDGNLDVIIQNTDGSIGVWYLGGTQGNQIEGFAPISGPLTGWKVVGMADLDNDGHPDTILQSTDGAIGVWYMTGAQGNQIQSFAVIADPSSWSVVGTIDMDSDGHPDLMIRNADGTLGIWYLGGAQGHQITGFTPLTIPGNTNWLEVTAH